MEKSETRVENAQNQTGEVPSIAQRPPATPATVAPKTRETFEELVAKMEQVSRVVGEVQEIQRSVAKPQAIPGAAATNPGVPETFEVVSIKPSPPPVPVPGGRTGGFGSAAITCLAAARGSQIQVSPTRFAVSRVSVHALIAAAYGVDCSLPETISAEPEWAKSEPFDIQAVIPAGPYNLTRHDVAGGNDVRFQSMLRNMLSERFRLRLRLGTREVSGFRLVASKTGTWDCHMPKTCHGLRLSEDQDPEGVGIDHEGRTAIFTTLALHTSISNWAMTVAERQVGRPVTDETGLAGFYDIRLEYPVPFDVTSLEGLERMSAEVKDRFPAAIQEQLGLKLQPARVSTTVLAIEHVEKPTPN
jgi:uncharacterized protein (TIGR03435 family)